MIILAEMFLSLRHTLIVVKQYFTGIILFISKYNYNPHSTHEKTETQRGCYLCKDTELMCGRANIPMQQSSLGLRLMLFNILSFLLWLASLQVFCRRAV